MELRKDGISSSQKPKSLALEKMETLVRQMQSQDAGVPVRCQKLFLTTIPSAFMGYDLIEWLMENLPIDDSTEALHLASLLCQHGYFFPVGDAKTLVVKDDSSLYRFQTPYYWPSQNHIPDSTDYAIYLHKKISKNKQKHGLEDCELDAYNQLKKTLSSKWDFVTMQADEQLKMAKDRKKGDKIVSESQERAYWRVYRPPPGFTNTLETPPVPDKGRPQIPACSSGTLLKKQRDFLFLCLTRLRIKISQVAESMVAHHETYLELDPFLSPVLPSNPWLTDDVTFMELNEPIVECPTERRVKRWAISMEETVSDPTGLHEFTTCMQKEFSHENIRFWSAVHQLKKAPLSQVESEVNNIYDEFLRPGAPCEINIDSKTMERTQELLRSPSRFTYDLAAEHIYDLLLKKDCYPRFLRSEHYKNLLLNATNPTTKKRFFTFGATGKKKISSVTPPNMSQLVVAPSRVGSDETPPAGANTVGPKPECDPPYRKDEDAGIFLGGPPSPPPTSRPPLSPSPSVTSGNQPRSPAALKQCEVPAPAASGATLASAIPTVAAAANIIGSAAIVGTPPSSPHLYSPSASSTAYSAAVLPTTAETSREPPSAQASVETSSRKTSTSEPPALSSVDLVEDAAQMSEPPSQFGPSVSSELHSPPVPTSGEVLQPASEGFGDGTKVEPIPPDVEYVETAPPPQEFAPQSGPAEPEADLLVGGVEAGAGESRDPEVGSRQPSAEDVEFDLTASACNYEQPSGPVCYHIQDPQTSEQERSNAENNATAVAAIAASRAAAILTTPLQLTPPPASDLSPWEPAAIAPPAAFQDLGVAMAAPLATIDESIEEPSSTSSVAPESNVTSNVEMMTSSPKTSHTEIVTLTDSCAQTVETGDSGDYGGTTDKQCEANLPRDGSGGGTGGRGTRRKEKRVKICELPHKSSAGEEAGSEADTSAAASATASTAAAGEASVAAAIATTSEADSSSRQRRRSRSGSAEGKKERRESRGKRDASKKKSSSERRRVRLDEAVGGEAGASPKRGNVVAPATAEPAPQTLDESSVCPWENDRPRADPARKVVVRWLDVETDI